MSPDSSDHGVTQAPAGPGLPKWVKGSALVMLGVIVSAILLANFGAPVFAIVEYVPGKDVTLHALLFGLLGLFVTPWLRSSANSMVQKHWGWILVGIGLLVVLEEGSQAFIPTRSFSLTDLAASLGGMIAGVLAGCKLYSQYGVAH